MRTYLTFGDIEGKLDMLRVECTRCQRKVRYSVAKLIEKYGRRTNMMKWREQLNGDCPKRDAHELHGRCDLICPDLPNLAHHWTISAPVHRSETLPLMSVSLGHSAVSA
jgi:hypothetical protein